MHSSRASPNLRAIIMRNINDERMDADEFEQQSEFDWTQLPELHKQKLK